MYVSKALVDGGSTDDGFAEGFSMAIRHDEGSGRHVIHKGVNIMLIDCLV